MAVTITAPNSQVASRSGSIKVAWEPEYPQSAYEILYRRKGEASWNTFGRVTGNAHQAELNPERFVDFEEYHYRVVCYSNDAANGTTIYSGSDSSAAYSLVVVPANRLATAKFRYGDGMVEVPIYTEEAVEGGIKVALSTGVRGEIPVGNADDAIASDLHIHIGGSAKAALGDKGNFQDSGVKAGAYMAVKSSYRYSYTNPVYYSSYKYSDTNPVYYYSYRYDWTNPTYYYSYKYSSTSAVYYYKYSYSYTTPVTYYKYSYKYTTPVTYYKYSYKYTTPVTYYKYSYKYTTPVTYYKYSYKYTTPVTYYKYSYKYTTPVTYYKYSYKYTTPVTYYKYSYSYTTAATYGKYKYAYSYAVYAYGYKPAYDAIM